MSCPCVERLNESEDEWRTYSIDERRAAMRSEWRWVDERRKALTSAFAVVRYLAGIHLSVRVQSGT